MQMKIANKTNRATVKGKVASIKNRAKALLGSSRKSLFVSNKFSAEEFDMDLLQTLQQFDKWSKDNPGKSYDDFLKEMGIDRAKLSSGGLSRKTLLTMLKNEYPKSYC